jgi:hypothetical protein
MSARRPPWHSDGRKPLRLTAPRDERTRTRALALPTAEERELQAKALRAAERGRLGAALSEGPHALASNGGAT